MIRSPEVRVEGACRLTCTMTALKQIVRKHDRPKTALWRMWISGPRGAAHSMASESRFRRTLPSSEKGRCGECGQVPWHDLSCYARTRPRGNRRGRGKGNAMKRCILCLLVLSDRRGKRVRGGRRRSPRLPPPIRSCRGSTFSSPPAPSRTGRSRALLHPPRVHRPPLSQDQA